MALQAQVAPSEVQEAFLFFQVARIAAGPTIVMYIVIVVYKLKVNPFPEERPRKSEPYEKLTMELHLLRLQWHKLRWHHV